MPQHETGSHQTPSGQTGSSQTDGNREPRERFDPTRPFTRAQAIRAGIDPGRLRSSAFRKVMRGVYVSRDRAHDDAVLTEAALAVHPPPAFASHVSAAKLWRIPVPTHPDEHVSVFDEDDRRRRNGVICHIASDSAPVMSHRGIRLSAPMQTFVELASMLSLVDLVVAGDHLVRKQWCTPDELVAFCRASSDKYADAALRAAQYVRAGVDSPMESRLRMLIVLAGLPEPTVNFAIRDDRGEILLRFDLSYPGLKLLVEYDGRQHIEREQNWEKDLERREEFDEHGWRIIVVTSRDIYRLPGRTVDRVHRALRRAGGRPKRPGTGWQRHFPCR